MQKTLTFTNADIENLERIQEARGLRSTSAVISQIAQFAVDDLNAGGAGRKAIALVQAREAREAGSR